MPTLLQQLSQQYEDKPTVGDSPLDVSSTLEQFRYQQQQQLTSTPLRHSEDRDYAAQQRENKLQLGQHEREQHLHQLQSINNMLLDLQPTSPGEYSKTSPTKLGPAALEDMSISEMFGLGLPRGSLMNDGQKEQGGQANFETISSYRNYHQRDKSTGNYSNTSSAEHHDSGYYSNMNSMDVPSSPNSVHTPASPSTPGSLYSNPYSSYSSASSSPYSSSESGYNKQYPQSPLRSPCYGRPIRGSTPYNDRNNSTMDFPQHLMGCNGSRSDSPADSDNSVNSIDGPLSDIMSYLSLNSGQHRCYPPNPAAILEVEKVIQNGRASMEIRKLKNYLQHSHQQPQAPMHHFHHHHGHGQSRNHHCNQPSSFIHHSIRDASSYSNPPFNADKNCCIGNPRSPTLNSMPSPQTPQVSLEKAARFHRNAAAGSDATHTWSGTLAQRTQKPIGYSSKVFLGGVPWDITESALIQTFKHIGPIKVEWPGTKDQSPASPKGYAYIIFESEKQVKTLLSCCTHDFSNGGSYYYKISSKRMKGKEVQVIPWALNDSNYVKSSSQKLDPEKTVFVGALHGMITATSLATIMNDLFDNVIYAGIDTDKHKYPIGSARITFSSRQSFIKAINAAFIEVKTPKFTKKIQVDPYIADAPCSSCYVQQGPYFCRETTCFKYYCHTCWQWVHSNESISWHMPMSRGLKNSQVIGLTPSVRAGRFSNMNAVIS